MTMDPHRPARLMSQVRQPRIDDPTVDEFVGEWWDSHAEAAYTHRDLVAAIPLLVRWILPHLGQVPVRGLSADVLTGFVDTAASAGATRQTLDACLDLIDDVLVHAARRDIVARNPTDDPDVVVSPCHPSAAVVQFPVRRPLGLDR